jgi:antitoxin (DNA-binding transcriptional repressor) of toxin-antitoxin stability system
LDLTYVDRVAGRADHGKKIHRRGSQREGACASLSIADAKKSLSALIKRAAQGERIEIGAYGRSQVVMGPSSVRDGGVRFGTLAGRSIIPDDIDKPLAANILAEFESGAR